MVASTVITHNTMGQTNVREGGIVTRWTKNCKRGAPLKVKAPTSNTKKNRITDDKYKAPVALYTDKHGITAPP